MALRHILFRACSRRRVIQGRFPHPCALRRVADAELRAQVRSRIDAAKRALGERGPVWWTDGAPDYNRRLVKNTPYAAWYAAASSGA